MIKSALKTGREMIYWDIYIFIYLRETMVVRLFNELMIFFFWFFIDHGIILERKKNAEAREMMVKSKWEWKEEEEERFSN